MVAARAKESLVDNTTIEGFAVIGITGQHMVERVGLPFEPELIHLLNIIGDAVDVGFTGANDNIIVVKIFHWSNALLEIPDEEVVPGSKSVMRVARGANERGFEIDGLVRVIVRRDLERVERVLGKPACFFVKNVSRFLPRQKDRPDVKHLFEHGVDFVACEKCDTSRCSHWPVDDNIEGEGDQTAPFLLRGVVGSLVEEFVEQGKHIDVIRDL